MSKITLSNGAECELSLSIGAIKRFKEKTGLTLQDALNTGDPVAFAELIYEAAVSGAARNKTELALTADEFCDLLDFGKSADYVTALMSDMPKVEQPKEAAAGNDKRTELPN